MAISARFLSFAQSKPRLSSANHRPGYLSNMSCDWPSTAWANSEQEAEIGPRYPLRWGYKYWRRDKSKPQNHHHWLHLNNKVSNTCGICSWWRHQMETFPYYWPFVRGIHGLSVNSPHKGKWRGAFYVSFDLRVNKRLCKQCKHQWFETPSRSLWRHYDVPSQCTRSQNLVIMSVFFYKKVVYRIYDVNGYIYIYIYIYILLYYI